MPSSATPPQGASSTEPCVTLTPEQIEFFERNGYLSLGPITTDAELSGLRDTYDRLFAARAGRAEGNQFDLGGADEEGVEAVLPQILNPSRYAPELAEGLFQSNALSIARQLLGPGAKHNGDHAIFKPAGTGASTPWHQDEAYWDPKTEYRSISIWMPFQEATIENGCLWFLPGSHRLPEVLPHHSIGHDPRVHGVEMEEGAIDLSAAVACPLLPGGVTIHQNRTLHYAGPNTSGVPRRAYIMGFGLPGKPYPTERRFVWNEIKQTPRDERSRAASEAAEALKIEIGPV